MPDLVDLYPGYASRWIDTSIGEIFARVGEAAGRRFCSCMAIRSERHVAPRGAVAGAAFHAGDRRPARLRLVRGAASAVRSCPL